MKKEKETETKDGFDVKDSIEVEPKRESMNAKAFLIRELQRGKISPNAIRHYVKDIPGFSDWAKKEFGKGNTDAEELYDALRKAR